MARFVIIGVAILLLVAGGFLLHHPDAVPESKVHFDGDSETLRQTAVVPTLDTPIPDGKSAIWCASFQLAWEKLKSDVVTGPVEITNAKVFCDRMNAAAPVADDLPTGSFFAAAGKVDDGIADEIRKGMARQFPKSPIGQMAEYPGGIIAYAHLDARVDFGHPYRDNTRPMLFRETNDIGNEVRSFGMPEGAFKVPHKTMEQGRVLFIQHDDGTHHRPTGYAVDLDARSQPSQIVLARICRRNTLGETLQELEKRIRDFAAIERRPWELTFSERDSLIVPNMHWRVMHQFRELLGPDRNLVIGGGSQPIVGAEQSISLLLDARGAATASTARIETKSSESNDYVFEQPFLLYIKKRDAAHPFFVMWVENAELLSPFGS